MKEENVYCDVSLAKTCGLYQRIMGASDHHWSIQRIMGVLVDWQLPVSIYWI